MYEDVEEKQRQDSSDSYSSTDDAREFCKEISNPSQRKNIQTTNWFITLFCEEPKNEFEKA